MVVTSSDQKGRERALGWVNSVCKGPVAEAETEEESGTGGG